MDSKDSEDPMYCSIFTYIWLILLVNVGKIYIRPMNPMGFIWNEGLHFFWATFWSEHVSWSFASSRMAIEDNIVSRVPYQGWLVSENFMGIGRKFQQDKKTFLEIPTKSTKWFVWKTGLIPGTIRKKHAASAKSQTSDKDTLSGCEV